MASHSYSDTCPNCGLDMDACEDSREGSFAWCPHCGYTMEPSVTQCPLDDLNERREKWCEAMDEPFEPFTELPKWNLPE